MSTLHKVKAYFGMAPMDDYEDEYYEDDDRDTGAATRGRGFPRRGERFAEDVYEDMRPEVRAGGRYDDRDHYEDQEPDYPPTGGFRVGGYAEEPRFRPREFERPNELPPRSRFGTMRGSTRGALAMDPRRMAMLFEEGSPMSKITTLRPKDYNEARTIGERFRDGQPVIMDLVSMDNADAKRLVDFAAGLAFALRGSFDKVATKVFLLAPADVDVSAEERRRIAEAGFYSYQ
jgi:cell division inhibitor SepF